MFFSKKKPRTLELDYTKPFIILNLKTYKEASGESALRLAKMAEKVQELTRLNIILAVQAIDLKDVASNVRIPVFAEHTDYQTPGKSTGAIVPENLTAINVHGTLLNHSEKRLDFKDLQQTILRLKELNIKTVVCAKDDKEAKKLAAMKPVRPDFIAVEPPELVGGEVSVSTAKPDVVRKAVHSCQEVLVLVGAGIKDNNDFRLGIQYGAKGVLLASHFVLARDPEKFLMDLVAGLY